MVMWAGCDVTLSNRFNLFLSLSLCPSVSLLSLCLSGSQDVRSRVQTSKTWGPLSQDPRSAQFPREAGHLIFPEIGRSSVKTHPQQPVLRETSEQPETEREITFAANWTNSSCVTSSLPLAVCPGSRSVRALSSTRRLNADGRKVWLCSAAGVKTDCG